ncbi:MAG: hypothetical protein ABR552_06935 [Actinomycetota bacterium]
MNGRPGDTVSLAHAQDIIRDLEADLRWTLESVEVLTRNGCHRQAVEILQAQRHDLDEVVTLLSFDAGIRRRRISAGARSFIAAAAAAVVVLAVGLAAMRGSGVGSSRPVAIAPTVKHGSNQTAVATSAPVHAVRTRHAVTPPTHAAPPSKVRMQTPSFSNRFATSIRADGPELAPTIGTPAPPPATIPPFLPHVPS